VDRVRRVTIGNDGAGRKVLKKRWRKLFRGGGGQKNVGGPSENHLKDTREEQRSQGDMFPFDHNATRVDGLQRKLQ